MDKLDLTKKYKSYFTAKPAPELVQIDPFQFISILGKGDPSGKEFADHIEALYSVAYTLKFSFKAREKDFVVSKLEGLWWFDEEKFSSKSIETIMIEVPRSEWQYRLLIMLPDFVTDQDLKDAIKAVVNKKGLALAQEIEFYTMSEGACVQMLHVGPFATEPETLKKIIAFTTENGLVRNGYHHEIYLSDFRKTAPSKLKTILREPVK